MAQTRGDADNPRLGKQPPLCELCEHAEVKMYCHNCPGSLCENCSLQHTTAKIFKGHVFTEFKTSISLNEITRSHCLSGDAESGLSKCPKHLNNELDSYCSTCSCFLCAECKPDHSTHPVQSARGNIQLFHKVCVKHIQGLLDGVHELNEYRNLIDDVFKTYDEAVEVVVEWETGLLQRVRDSALKLKKEFAIEKEKWIKVLSQRKQEAVELSERVDKEINKLNDMRNFTDCEILSHELSNSQSLLDKLTLLVQDQQQKIKVPQLGKLIPSGSQIPAICTDIDTVFSMTPTEVFLDSTDYPDSNVVLKIPSLLQDSLILKGVIHIPNARARDGYKFSRGGDISNIVLHGVSSKDISNIRVLDLEQQTVTIPQQDCPISIWNMTSLSPHCHIAKNNKVNELHLLDNTFNTITQHISNNRIWAISTWFHDSFIMYEYESKLDQHVALISTMKLIGNAFKVEETVQIILSDEAIYMGVETDGSYIILCSHEILYKVDLKHKNCTTHRLAKIHGYVRSVVVDGDYILIGEANGNTGKVHVYDQQYNHECLLAINGGLKDMIVRNGQLLVSTLENKVLIYSEISRKSGDKLKLLSK